MNFNQNTLTIVEGINNYANNILLHRDDDEGLLSSLENILEDIKKVMDTSTYQQLDDYCDKYNGFYRYARLLERVSDFLNHSTPMT